MLEARSFSKPDEAREFDKGKVDIVTIGGTAITLQTFQPGWSWMEHVKPIAKTDHCMVDHKGYVVSGRLHIKTKDGEEGEVGAGDLFVVPAGHEGWVVGEEPCVIVDWAGDASYGKPK